MGMLRTGTELAIAQELLHGGEVARGPQPFSGHGAREGLERGLGAPPIASVAGEAGAPQQPPPRPTISARQPIVAHAVRPPRGSRPGPAPGAAGAGSGRCASAQPVL